jgi:hypothetical protein
MGTAKKSKNVSTDKGQFARLLQRKVVGSGHTQIPSGQKPVQTMAALTELGLAGKKELQARYIFRLFCFTSIIQFLYCFSLYLDQASTFRFYFQCFRLYTFITHFSFRGFRFYTLVGAITAIYSKGFSVHYISARSI